MQQRVKTQPSSNTGKLGKTCFFFCLYFCNMLQLSTLKPNPFSISNILTLTELWGFFFRVIHFFFAVPILVASSLFLQYFTVYSLLIWLIFERSSLMFSVCKQLSATIVQETIQKKKRIVLER